jgi:hypothetical protein
MRRIPLSFTRSGLALALAASGFLLGSPPAAAKPPDHASAKKVKVVNGPNRPVPVVDVGAPAREPFHAAAFIDVTGFLHDPVYSVPPGMRAVIETVTVLVTFPVSQGVGGFLSVQTELGGETADHYLVLTTQGTVLASEARTANHAVRLYADPGTQVFLNGAIQAGSSLHLSLSGYLEEVP